MDKSTYCHVLASELRIGMFIAKLGDSWIDHPFIRTSFLIKDAKDLQKVINAGIKEVWIDETRGISKPEPKPIPEEENRIEAASESMAGLQPEAIPDHIQQRSLKQEIHQARAICLSATKHVENMFNDVRLGKGVDMAVMLPVVENIIDSIARNSTTILSVVRLKNHDNYTYMHSVAVCALMVALAKQLQLDENQIRICGQCGLLHDIGKAFMPLDILNKPDRLTHDEFEIIKRHPVIGAQILARQHIDHQIYDVVLHHHEKMDGTGYPDGLKADQISLYAKMAACCDVYDAVTSARVYKKPWSPAYALQKMAQWKGHFDAPVFQAFVKSVGIYPVGSLVRLSSERLAVVVEPCEDSLLRPKVCEFFAIAKNEMVPMKIIDLNVGNALKILGPENPEKWGFNNLDAMWQ